MLMQDSSGTQWRVVRGRARVREDRQERCGLALSRVLDKLVPYEDGYMVSGVRMPDMV